VGYRFADAMTFQPESAADESEPQPPEEAKEDA
jgi:hypothetical protein